MKDINLKVEGMECKGCENRIQNTLLMVDGVKDVKADHVSGNIKIKADDNVNEEELKQKIEELDYKVL